MFSVTASGDHHDPARGLFLRRDGRLFLEVTENGVSKLVAWKGTAPAMYVEQYYVNTPAGERLAQETRERGVFTEDSESNPADWICRS